MSADAACSGASIQVVSYEPEHFSAATTLIVSIQRDEFGFDIDLARQPDLSDIPVFYQTGTGNFWVALNGDTVVGTIALKDIGEGLVALRKMFVAPNYRGTAWGVAAKLLHTAIDWARQQEVRSIFLGTTEKFRAAHRFYEKHGFELIEKALLPTGFLFMPVDTRFYRLDLE
ncbi:GNAT family N-acetyltransferase [Dyella caseinilytica]|uniref:GNAT family N-acetyltransferase n=1 Tax=Dyella caseinilytica TaxID=1849581 RepID=A0ABX7GX31_9GAMM|nr:GNAT family N-acetyltransferase [Dyella caseinilytica]QRN54414.1 GNAT family N-acetyltransferase [Dyella caseinilytica]GFZ94055.1 N-acetyltransferase [Dyella caseinilytica]